MSLSVDIKIQCNLDSTFPSVSRPTEILSNDFIQFNGEFLATENDVLANKTNYPGAYYPGCTVFSIASFSMMIPKFSAKQTIKCTKVNCFRLTSILD